MLLPCCFSKRKEPFYEEFEEWLTSPIHGNGVGEWFHIHTQLVLHLLGSVPHVSGSVSHVSGSAHNPCVRVYSTHHRCTTDLDEKLQV